METWCYRKPGFEALLITELQRQQQCSQFCDTLLKADGVSVPAHSCILSAISPHISSALSSSSPPLSGQRRLLDFGSLDACTLLHLVKLLYSGEMAGEGEREKQEAVSAAAKLGIDGLVEVTKRDWKCRNGDGVSCSAEVGMQTETEEREKSRWRRELRDGDTFLWKEPLSEGGHDAWTQTEEAAPSLPPPASFETIDIETLQSLSRANSHLVPTQIVIYPPNHTDCVEEASAAGCAPLSVVTPQYTSVPLSLPPFTSQMSPEVSNPPNWWTVPQTEGEEWEEEHFEQFEGNISGFISYFLNPDIEQGSRRRRAGNKRGALTGRAKRAQKRPRGKPQGRRAAGLTTTVDVQKVLVAGRLQKLLAHRSGVSAGRMGQGGGGVGRKLFLKTREVLNSTKQKRSRVRGKEWEVTQTGDLRLCLKSKGGGRGGGGGNGQRSGKNAEQQVNQDGLPVTWVQRSMGTYSSSVSFSNPLVRFDHVPDVDHHGSPVPSPTYSHTTPAASILHTTRLPPAGSLPQNERPEHIDRVLEEVMMGIDIMADSSHPAASRTENQQRDHRFSEVVELDRRVTGCGFTGGEEPVVQQACEGGMNQILEEFLQSYELHIENAIDAGEGFADVMQPSAVGDRFKTPQTSQPQNTQTPQRIARPQGSEEQRDETLRGHSDHPDLSCVGSPGRVKIPAAKRSGRRRKELYTLYLKGKRVRVRMPARRDDANVKVTNDLAVKQLQQMPVVKLDRCKVLPSGAMLQKHGGLQKENPVRATNVSSTKKRRWCRKTQLSPLGRKIYPIRNRYREPLIFNNIPIVVEPPKKEKKKSPPSAPRSSPERGPSKKTRSVVAPRSTDQQVQMEQETRDKESTIQLQKEVERPPSCGEKRGSESIQDPMEDATVTKRLCSNHPALTTCADFISGPAVAELEEPVDVETIYEPREDESSWSEIPPREPEECVTGEERENSDNEVIDMEGDSDKSRITVLYSVQVQHPVSPPRAQELSPEWPGNWQEDRDEDVDVMGGSSPAFDPVGVIWSSEGEEDETEEEEEIDVVGDKTDSASSPIFTAVSQCELIRRCAAEVL